MIIDSPSQIAKNVITSGHLLNREVSQLDLKHPVLKLSVKEDGSVVDDDDGTAVRAGNGDYFVTFDATIRTPAAAAARTPCSTATARSTATRATRSR